jgi:hypothetical protein
MIDYKEGLNDFDKIGCRNMSRWQGLKKSGEFTKNAMPSKSFLIMNSPKYLYQYFGLFG